MRLGQIVIALFVVTTVLGWPAQAAEKTWEGAGDSKSWFDDPNWLPAAAPAPADDVMIDSENAGVNISQTFNVRSLTIGGHYASTLTSDEFISGTVDPGSGTKVAILNRRGGKLILKRAGALKTKGQYKDSEESLANQPSLVFYVK